MNPLLLLLLAALTAQAATFTGKVVGVSDGDTLTVLAAGNKQFKIRLLAIDTPESGQAFGDKAKQALSNKVFGKFVQVHWTEQDKFKRVLGNITIGQRWINYEMVAEGWGWHYKQYDKDKRFAAAEVKAKAARKGLWGGQNPVAPWEWRREKKGGNRPVAKPPTKPLSRIPATPAGIVYIAKTGKKYDTAGCQHVRQSRIAIALVKARRSRPPCKRCKPERQGANKGLLWNG
jgi:endonuclease YncB( thermonuclease family)